MGLTGCVYALRNMETDWRDNDGIDSILYPKDYYPRRHRNYGNEFVPWLNHMDEDSYSL